MEQGLVKKETLTAIGNSIRAKNGTETTYTPAEMPGAIEAIKSGAENQQLDVVANGTYNAPEGVGYSPVVVNVPQDGGPTAKDLILTGNCNYRFANGGWDWIVKKYGNQITTKDITNCSNMFQKSAIETIPFEINCLNNAEIDFTTMFEYTDRIKEVPKINNAKPTNMFNMFANCKNITEFPADMNKWFDWSAVDGATGPYNGGNMRGFCSDMTRLRKYPNHILQHGNPYINVYNTNYSYCVALHVLDEIIDLPNPHYKVEWKTNAFQDFGNNYNHLKDLTFAPTMTNGEPNNPKWSNQTIDLTNKVGYNKILNLSDYGLPKEKEIKDDDTYQQFKNDPDAWTHLQEYSRYNHDSAVRTINSLPDTSAFIASNGGTNTIKFFGDSGSKTDGGAINTLTEAEIAVAAAKGWTVTLV